MNIYINARFLTQPVSGVQRYGIECSRKIKKLHPECVFLSPGNIWDENIANELGCIRIGNNTGHMWEQYDLPRYMKKKGGPLWNPCNTAPLLYKNNYITLHDLAYHHHPGWNTKAFSTWYNFMIPKALRRSKHVFTVSNTIKEEIQQHYHIPAAKLSVTYNGLSEAMQHNAPATGEKKEKTILAVGSFNLRKNHHSLIKAFVESDIKEQYRLVVVGDKNKVFSETGIDETTLAANNITLLRQLNEAELTTHYRKAEIVVSLSLYEGFGIPVLEGLASGCKVVCSDIPVYKELYEGNAHFCNPTDIAAITGQLKKAINATAPGHEAVQQLMAKYNYETAARMIVNQMLGH